MRFVHNSNDRRRRRRQLLNTSVRISSASIDADALGVNVSDVGMCLFAIANLRLGSQIELEFIAPGCKERVRICGTVRHRALYLYGIEFLPGSEKRPSPQIVKTQPNSDMALGQSR
jgi:hypothetical protein